MFGQIIQLDQAQWMGWMGAIYPQYAWLAPELAADLADMATDVPVSRARLDSQEQKLLKTSPEKLEENFCTIVSSLSRSVAGNPEWSRVFQTVTTD